MSKNKRTEISIIIIGYIGVMLCTLGLVMFFKYVLMSLPLVLRMAAGIIFYWIIALVPLIIIFASKEKFTDYGFAKEHIPKQIITGIGLGITLSFVFTVIPHLLGYGEYFNSGKEYTHIWQYVYEFVYCIIAIGSVEELVFRGFFYVRLQRITNNSAALIISSILFGAFHIFGGNIAQLITTAFLGALFCIFRSKIKNFTLLSLIIMHGIYDALITVWSNIL